MHLHRTRSIHGLLEAKAPCNPSAGHRGPGGSASARGARPPRRVLTAATHGRRHRQWGDSLPSERALCRPLRVRQRQSVPCPLACACGPRTRPAAQHRGDHGAGGLRAEHAGGGAVPDAEQLPVQHRGAWQRRRAATGGRGVAWAAVLHGPCPAAGGATVDLTCGA